MNQALQEAEKSYFQTISPVDGSVYCERPYHSIVDIEKALAKAKLAENTWRKTPLSIRKEILTKALDILISWKNEISEELTWQMGRPISQTPGEVKGLEERARYMIKIADEALADIVPEKQNGFKRYIKRVPVGTVAIVAPWNYPYLTSVNGIFPALLAGNTVILKHSEQTPLCADRYRAAFEQAGIPEGVFQSLDLTHEDTAKLVADPRVDFVNFTGSVAGGRAMQKAVSDKFIRTGLELGGKDAAYVREDADLKNSIESLVDGAFFNSGQSCCGIERIYVASKIYDDFVEYFVEFTKDSYILDNPLEKDTNIGPMVRSSAADFVRSEVKRAIDAGAKALIDESLFPASKKGTPYIAPQVLVDVDHSMSLMTEENFGPVVGIMKVNSDAEALSLINDSKYGLTASIWTNDIDAVEKMAEDLEVGTVFMNRCDYLDPALAWVGVKDSGCGCTLSKLGFESLTRPKSHHLKLDTRI